MVRDLPGIEAEEVLQETMSRASREDLARFPTDVDLLMWCTRVGINLIAKQAGNRARRMEQLHPDPGSAAESQAAHTAENLEDQVIRRAELVRIFPQLRQEHREVLLLAATGHSYDEMAEILKISRDAVSQRLRRARVAAQAILGPMAVASATLTVGRRTVRSIWRPTHPLPAGVAAAAMAVVLVCPLPAHTATRAITGPFASSPASVIDDPTRAPAQTAAANHPRARGTTAQRAAHHLSAGKSNSRPRLLSSLPKTCAAGQVCVAPACTSDQQGDSGDWLYVKATGGCVNENATPICQAVPDNPAVGCERSGQTQWLVQPPPSSASTGGTP
jgi:RNA polymerase sigma factor (sigma-70 family)